MASHPNRKLWLVFVVAHVILVVGVGAIAGAGHPAGLGWQLTVVGFAGVGLMVVGLYVQRQRLVSGSWIVLVGLIPTLFSPTGALVLIHGFWTANLVFSAVAPEGGFEALSRRRVDAFGHRSWVWFAAAGVLLAVTYLALVTDNGLVAGLVFPAGAVAAFIGIGILGRATDRRGTASALERSGSPTMRALQEGWWLLGAALIATVFAVVSLIDFLERDGAPIFERVAEVAVLVVAATVVLAGLLVRGRSRRLGSALVTVGALPGAAAIILFWHPGFLVFGLLSIAVVTTAFIDARTAGRPVPAHG